MAEMKELSDKIKVLDAEVSQLDAEIKDTLLNIPNVPDGLRAGRRGRQRER